MAGTSTNMEYVYEDIEKYKWLFNVIVPEGPHMSLLAYHNATCYKAIYEEDIDGDVSSVHGVLVQIVTMTNWVEMLETALGPRGQGLKERMINCDTCIMVQDLSKDCNVLIAMWRACLSKSARERYDAMSEADKFAFHSAGGVASWNARLEEDGWEEAYAHMSAVRRGRLVKIAKATNSGTLTKTLFCNHFSECGGTRRDIPINSDVRQWKCSSCKKQVFHYELEEHLKRMSTQCSHPKCTNKRYKFKSGSTTYFQLVCRKHYNQRKEEKKKQEGVM